jgi:hypothetical protein
LGVLQEAAITLAVSALTRTVEKEPKNPVYHYHLGLAYAQGGMRLAPANRSSEPCRLTPPSLGLTMHGACSGELDAATPTG